MEIELDGSFVHELIITHGVMHAIEILHKCFTKDMNYNVKDEPLRIMLWQITHSLDELEIRTGRSYTNVNDIEHLSRITEDKDTQTSTRHILGALDSLTSHSKYLHGT